MRKVHTKWQSITKWLQLEWTLEPDYRFSKTQEMRSVIQKALNTGKIIRCIGCS